MEKQREPRNTFFNFRITHAEMNQIRDFTKKFNYTSYAEFIRASIREKIKREKAGLENGK